MHTENAIEVEPTRVRILGIPISLVNMSAAVALVSRWSRSGPARRVFVRETASLMSAVDEPYLRHLHEDADLIVADGTPLVWISRIRGYGEQIGRIPGADLLDAVCSASLQTGGSHFFFGGRPGVAEEVAAKLTARFPGLKIAGTLCPPMRHIGPDFKFDPEALHELQVIRESKADFIWVGLSSPKQEYWMSLAAPLLDRGVLFGVGAAFDFHAGTVKRAPRWMRENGLEWAHRLLSEPRRLWRRYLIQVPRFLIRLAKEEASLRLKQEPSRL